MPLRCERNRSRSRRPSAVLTFERTRSGSFVTAARLDESIGAPEVRVVSDLSTALAAKNALLLPQCCHQDFASSNFASTTRTTQNIL